MTVDDEYDVAYDDAFERTRALAIDFVGDRDLARTCGLCSALLTVSAAMLATIPSQDAARIIKVFTDAVAHTRKKYITKQ